MGNIRGGTLGFHGTIGQPTAQVIDGSLKFDSASSQYLSSTSTFQNSKSYEMTFSFWLKRCAPTAVKATQYILKTNQEGTIFFDNDNSDQLAFNLRGSSGTNFFTYTSAKLRDYNAWYHVVVALNLGSGTQSQRFKCYINNVEQMMTNTSYPSNAYHTGGTWYIGSYNGSSHYPDYYLSNFYCISGQVLDPSYFGFTDPQTNTWRPKKYTGTFTFDNSFYLPLDNEDDFGKDKSGEGNHFTQNNFSGTSIEPDVVKDSPSGAVFGGRAQTGITTTSSAPANYCTWNPLAISASNPTLSNGNLSFTGGSSDPNKCLATIGMSSGKFYAEFTVVSGSINPGLATKDINLGSGFLGDNAYGWTYGSNGKKYHNDASAVGATYGDSYTTGDAIGVAFDADNGILTFYKNGVSQGAAYTGLTSGPYFFATGGSSMSHRVNFGQKPFKYAPPQGYSPLNSATARPNKVVPRPDQYVGVATYIGNGGTQSIDVSHAPDLVWIKNRDDGEHHGLFDTIRGPLMRIVSDYNYASTSRANTVTSFNHNGFTIGSAGEYNGNNDDIVAWCWKAGGNKNTFNVDDIGYASAAAAGLDSGSNTVTGASVGTKQGFSIIKYTGGSGSDTVSHGLTQPPDLLLVKQLNNAGTESFHVMHSALGATHRGKLDSTAAFSDTDDGFGDVNPTSSVFTVAYNGTNKDGSDYISYCWHDVLGLQKFGEYEGNGSSNGAYVELGFRPALVMCKNVDAIQPWQVYDSKRGPENVITRGLQWSSANNEYAGTARIDFLSNGFKVRGDGGAEPNVSGQTYIFAAWAEAPASNLFGGQSNAR